MKSFSAISISSCEHDAFFGKNLSVYQPTTATTDSPNFRALCAELTKWLTLSGNPPREVIDRTRAALATPPPDAPTVMEIIELSDKIEEAGLGQIDLVRAALERWGR